MGGWSGGFWVLGQWLGTLIQFFSSEFLEDFGGTFMWGATGGGFWVFVFRWVCFLIGVRGWGVSAFVLGAF